MLVPHRGGYRDSPEITTLSTTPSRGLALSAQGRMLRSAHLQSARAPPNHYTFDHTPSRSVSHSGPPKGCGRDPRSHWMLSLYGVPRALPKAVKKLDAIPVSYQVSAWLRLKRTASRLASDDSRWRPKAASTSQAPTRSGLSLIALQQALRASWGSSKLRSTPPKLAQALGWLEFKSRAFR
jgi:hypothetical protein